MAKGLNCNLSAFLKVHLVSLKILYISGLRTLVLSYGNVPGKSSDDILDVVIMKYFESYIKPQLRICHYHYNL